MRYRTVSLLLVLLISAVSRAADWPAHRGPGGQGHSDATGLPLEWSETRNVKFKTPIPGRGWSSPVVLGDQVWMTTATEGDHSLRAVCVARNSGKITHDVEVFHPQALEHTNEFNSNASPTPVIEPGRLYVCFGSYGSACLDTSDGRVLWRNQELKVVHMEGPGSSPVIYRDLYILHCDGADAQYVAALDKATGKIAWKTLRSAPFTFVLPPMRKAFGTPLLIHADGKDQLVSPGARRLYSYDPATGKELWHVDLEPPAFSTAPVPVFADGVVYACTGFNQAQLWAVRVAGASGDVTRSHVLWKYNKGVPLRSSPLVQGGLLYFVSDAGIARCLDAKTGEQVWQGRIGTAFSASPVYVDGRIYFFAEDGAAVVLQPGREFKTLATNQLAEGCLATPGVAGSALFVRTRTNLYRVEN